MGAEKGSAGKFIPELISAVSEETRIDCGLDVKPKAIVVPDGSATPGLYFRVFISQIPETEFTTHLVLIPDEAGDKWHIDVIHTTPLMRLTRKTSRPFYEQMRQVRDNGVTVDKGDLNDAIIGLVSRARMTSPPPSHA
jgi:alanine-alpha-ketoisovalerate/valine-pyruvate aminotransferase